MAYLLNKSYRGSHTNATDLTGSLLRMKPDSESDFISNTPVPNDATVTVIKTEGEFSFIEHEGQSGWVRSKYLRDESVGVSTSFTLTTYNILTGGEPFEGLSPYEAETTIEKYSLWANRKDLVVDALRNSSIVMLNEATDGQLNYVVSQLDLVVVSRMLKQDQQDGSAILVNPNEWKHVASLEKSSIRYTRRLW